MELDISTTAGLADALKAFPGVTKLKVRIGRNPANHCHFHSEDDCVVLSFTETKKPPTPEESAAELTKELVESDPEPRVPRRK